MRKFLMIAAVAAMAVTCQAREPFPAPAIPGAVFYQPEATPAVPTPAEPGTPLAQPVPMAEPVPGTLLTPGQPVELYQNVKVIQTRNIHPCAVPMIVAVQNPCDPCCGCVFVEICVPPCDPLCIKCNCRGNRVVYDFGQYGVKLISHRNGTIVVNYDD